MAERAVNRFERVLRAAVGFRLAEADVGQFALDEVDDAGVHRLRRVGIAVAFRERDQTGMLAFERAQDVVQPFLDPAEIDGRSGGTVGGFQAFQQIGYALFEMGKGRRIVVADRDAVEPLRQRAQRAFEKFRVVARGRRLPVLQRRAQRGDALLEHGKGIAVAARNATAGRPWSTACARRRQAAPARRWRRRWKRCREVRRSRLRAAAPSTDRRSSAGSDRAWRRDCGSHRRSRPVVRPASASAALRGFRRARARCRRAPGRRCRSGGCRRCGGTACGFRSRSIRSPGAASPR